jgi:hypothetical protein
VWTKTAQSPSSGNYIVKILVNTKTDAVGRVQSHNLLEQGDNLSYLLWPLFLAIFVMGLHGSCGNIIEGCQDAS